MTPEQKKQIRQQNESWAAGGLRVLAVAYRPLEQMQACSPELENSGIFLGMAAMLDPPRPESKMAVLTAKKAGIHPVQTHKMVGNKQQSHSISECCGILVFLLPGQNRFPRDGLDDGTGIRTDGLVRAFCADQ